MGTETHMSVKQQAWALGYSEEECLVEIDQLVQRPQYNSLAIMLFPIQLPWHCRQEQGLWLVHFLPYCTSIWFWHMFLSMPFIRLWIDSLLFLVCYKFFSWMVLLICTYGDFMAFLLHSVDTVNYILIPLLMLKQTCILGIYPSWSWYIILFLYFPGIDVLVFC